jgi:hypothetical protein
MLCTVIPVAKLSQPGDREVSETLDLAAQCGRKVLQKRIWEKRYRYLKSVSRNARSQAEGGFSRGDRVGRV